ncbi:hypothetical protein MTP04_11730 [Lysinibacillus sp. PLM2]|nr:hypothetical protein MTP04_11730 [Lysinibacillus sp. PLM2]
MSNEVDFEYIEKTIETNSIWVYNIWFSGHHQIVFCTGYTT